MMKLAPLILLLFAVLSAGCAAVSPWEKGTLAKSQMALDPHPLQAVMRAHNYSSREAAVGGHASGGGGCGCY